jgi:pyruvate dehydrogenase E1 component beta subunit
MAAALNRAGRQPAADDRVVVFGEDVGTLGCSASPTVSPGVRRAPRLRHADAESGIVGTAIGTAMNGLSRRPRCSSDAFAYPAFEQVRSHLAKLRN